MSTYTLQITSWENDGDAHKTQTLPDLTEEDAKLVQIFEIPQNWLS